jgi:outer membrane phospholipase A
MLPHHSPRTKAVRTGAFLAVLIVYSLVAALSAAHAQGLTTALVAPVQPIAAGGVASIWLVVFNTTDRPTTWRFPARLEATLRAGTAERTAALELRDPAGAGEVEVPPGGYARREYLLSVPPGVDGPVAFSVRGVQASAVLLDVQKAAVTAAPDAPPDETPKASERPGQEIALVDYFKEHISGYQPFYFIAGTESPNAKFQISFKYRLFSEGGSFVQKVPPLKGLFVAYTQTSLWDWEEPSAPFLDTSYKPEAFYVLERLDGGRWGDGVRFDLQAGFQHESNGKGGADSRSLNIVYLEPTVVLGKPDAFQLRLAPRAWAYVGSLGDNPDIARYYGYFGMRAVVGWADGVQLSAFGRIGDAWDRGSLQLDLTYPLARLFADNLAIFLQAQYFLGYGESLLLYNERTSSLRFGLAIYR